MLRIWGRADSTSVRKVLWCCAELDVGFDRIDAGLHHGRTQEPQYLAMNPNATVPTLEHDGFTLWESHAIMRYLAQAFGGHALHPVAPRPRAVVDQWLDWTLARFQPSARLLSPAALRSAAQPADPQAGVEQMAANMAILEQQLAKTPFVAGDRFTLADIALGVIAARWYGASARKAALPAADRWWSRLGERPGFQRHVAAGSDRTRS